MTDNQTMPETYVPEDFRMGSWILKTELSSGAKLTFSVLAVCAGGRDYVWPSQKYLAGAVSASVRSVQRYLKELAEFGLIRIGKKWLLGQTRTIYSFLNHALISFEPTVDQKPARKKAQETGQVRPPKTAKAGDKNDIPHNKEESDLENNKIPPSSPPKDESLVEAELLTAEAVLGEGEGFDSDNSKEKSGTPPEDEAWRRAKRILAERLTEYDLRVWIKPIIFDNGGCRAVLRMPNLFYLTQVKQRFGTELTEAFKAVGVPELRFELLTSEQQDKLEEMAKIKNEQRARKKEAAAAEAKRRSEAQIENLPPKSKFNLLYSAYPVDKARDQAERVFMRLHQKGELPSMSDLFRSIKEHQAQDRWWREKMPPLLSNWLAKEQWKDKPYA